MTSAQYRNKTYYFMEHRVVWCWHNGAIPNGLVVNHKDYNRSNNLIDNLELLTQKENTEYSRCHFNPCRGERGKGAKFTDKQASAIKTLGLNCGWSANKIANLIGEQQYNVSRIIRGERYASVPSYDDILKAYPIIVDYTRNKDIGELEEIKNYLLGLGGDDGFPGELAGIAFPRWRREAVKACGNAIVPQVALRIFETINEMLTINGGIRFFDKSKADNPDIEENQNDQRK